MLNPPFNSARPAGAVVRLCTVCHRIVTSAQRTCARLYLSTTGTYHDGSHDGLDWVLCTSLISLRVHCSKSCLKSKGLGYCTEGQCQGFYARAAHTLDYATDTLTGCRVSVQRLVGDSGTPRCEIDHRRCSWCDRLYHRCVCGLTAKSSGPCLIRLTSAFAPSLAVTAGAGEGSRVPCGPTIETAPAWQASQGFAAEQSLAGHAPCSASHARVMTWYPSMRGPRFLFFKEVMCSAVSSANHDLPRRAHAVKTRAHTQASLTHAGISGPCYRQQRFSPSQPAHARSQSAEHGCLASSSAADSRASSRERGVSLSSVIA